MSLDEFLNEDILGWLLEEENPSIRYWALQQLQDKSPTDADVVEAQKRVMKSDCVKAILDAQTGDYFWGKPNDLYNPKYRAATHNLLILSELG
ncbi:MAG: nitrogen fixation protein NifH, partial [Candidatus Thorarchaeota archaeon]